MPQNVNKTIVKCIVEPPTSRLGVSGLSIYAMVTKRPATNKAESICYGNHDATDRDYSKKATKWALLFAWKKFEPH